MITASAGLACLIAVVATSAVVARRRLRYETWYFVHLYAYLGVALAFSHQLATGTEFVGRPGGARLLVRAVRRHLGSLVVAGSACRCRSLYHRLRVERSSRRRPASCRWRSAASGCSDSAQAGQFFGWRFLTRDRWWEAHPFSLSAAPDGRRLRITVKGVGDYTAALRAMPSGTRVIAEGPFGAFTAAARRPARGADRRRRRDHADPRAAGGDARRRRGHLPGGAEDLILREELDELAGRRGAEVHYVVGPRASASCRPSTCAR